jgi:hypothetical protein
MKAAEKDLETKAMLIQKSRSSPKIGCQRKRYYCNWLKSILNLDWMINITELDKEEGKL